MIDPSYALGIMAFNTMGSMLMLATWEYLRTRRELNAVKMETVQNARPAVTPELAPARG